MIDDEIDKLGAGNNYPGTVPGMRKFARAILAAYQAKLLAGVEMPEYKYIDRHDVPKEGMCVYTADQLQAYAAACAAQARMKALSDAKGACVDAKSTIWDYHGETQKQIGRNVCDNLAAAIESLKEQP